MQALRLLFVVTAVPFMRIVEGAQVCGLRTAQGRTFVRNGQDTTNTTEIPWNVIVYDMKVKTGPTQICGGSLIKTDYFISAAHCFYINNKFLRNVTDFSAVVGGLYSAWNATEDTRQHVQLKQIYVHSFTGPLKLFSNDIALVLLSTHVSINVNVLPICLDWGQRLPPLPSGTLGLVAGFGGYRDMQYDVLKYTTLPFLDHHDCEKNTSLNLQMYTTVADKFCVGVNNEVVVPNLDAKCLRCICEAASGCNTTYGCALGFCGPFYMSRVYWRDGGKPVLPEDDPIRAGAYEDCGRNYTCSAVTVTNYMSKYGQDCNGDGHTNCDDYAMIHFNGGNACYQPMGDTNFSARYELCRADTLSLPPRTYHSLINSSTGMASADTSASVLQCGCSASYVFAAVIVSMWGAARRPHYMHRASILAATSF
ncbi:CLIP domain-containing serine protease B10 isoform X2 [Frankliniella occidentalis]|uniref:lysozyme n=1 Tax=Frankliniella occidentalis TaxID=133901 RepID=A0A6J1TQF0_FRAOC|nr:CLIP domain-containing serine protease B10 isoform X2 [Frankliniella occidentalis]